MPDNINTKSILKDDPALRGLDFATMRAEGINYVAELSGKIWTDHNVHDPGITILELLSYALIDLGYRTRMPAADIFSRDPADQSQDDNFFTPAQILTCNPVTILDYRKLLIDIKEVKNAWLVVDDKWLDCQNAQPVNTNEDAPECKYFLNGLYKVYLELYKGPYKPAAEWTKKEREYIEAVVEKVREILMAHRNLCEDFVSITVLCKEKIGVCADIELEPTADAEKTYVKIVETLRAFFSPDPKYYTLPQLLDKGKPIEEIFAGRPYLVESHGFVDNAELEALPFRKEIHVSDVYNALFGIEGVRTVRKLRLRKCGSPDGNTEPGECDWKYFIAQNHTTEFSLDCSGFRFTRNEMPVSVNEKKYKAFFDLGYSFSGKVLHTGNVDALDLSIPKGIYHADLSNYYSIQNELPRVYGIDEGGIPDTATTLRKAQAFQLKGYLLFFDQLLANYLAQLSQIRKLFAFKSSKNESHTYFTAVAGAVPDIDKLLRFGLGDGSGSVMGGQGAIQAIPVEKDILDDLIAQDKLKTPGILSSFEQLEFGTAADRDTTIYSMMEDLRNKNFTIQTVSDTNDNWLFYIYTTSNEVALVSRKYYPSRKEAKLAATNVSYIGTFKENYHSYTKSNTSLSYFSLELNMAGYSVYLQQLAEDKELYLERRKAFLDHLLARFAESFTDFALLSFDTLQEQHLKEKDLIRKGKFLENYDVLGRDRGKAFDYYVNGWNTNNISGFEKRVRAFTGMGDCCGQTVSHFEVLEYTGQYFWTISAAGKNMFKSNTLFDSPAEAAADLEEFVAALKNEEAYKPQEVALHDAHALSIQYKEDKITYGALQPSEEKANKVGEQVRRIITATPGNEDIFVSNEVYKLQLYNDRKEPVRRTEQPFQTQKQALSAAKQLIKKINDEEWEVVSGDPAQKPRLDLKAGKTDPSRLVDISHFVKNTWMCPDEYRWRLNDSAGQAVLLSEHTYPSHQVAIESLLNELTAYEINIHSCRLYEEDGYRFSLISKEGNVLATSPAYPDEGARTQAIQFVIEFCEKERTDAQYTYHITGACRWQVQFGSDLVFQSVTLLADPENAMNTWRKDRQAFKSIENYIWDWDEYGKQRVSIKDEQGSIVARLLPASYRENLHEDLFAVVQSSFDDKTFKAEAVKVEEAYGFRLNDQGQVLLSGYEVYDNRGAAFFNLLRTLEKAGIETMYLKSGDEGNRQFTFLLKADSSQFLAEHPVMYDNEKEREDMLQKTIEYLKNLHAPATAAKEPVRYTFNVASGDQVLIISAQKFPSIREAAENANLVLIQASDAGNYRFPRDPDTGEYRVMLIGPHQWLAGVPGKFMDEIACENARNNTVEAISPHVYHVHIIPVPDKWRFNLYLGIEPWRTYFQSADEYDSMDLAQEAYKKMATDMAGLKIQRQEGMVQLISKQKINKTNITANLQEQQGGSPENATPDTALAISQMLYQLSTTEDKKVFQRLVKQDPLAQQGTWVYRVRKREEYFAYHLDCAKSLDKDKLIKDLHYLVTHKPDYLLICLGGDIIYKRKDPVSGDYSYHYMIKARNITYPGPDGPQDLILFISTTGYVSIEEAEKAFNENYLLVLKRASKAFHYGSGKFISLEEIFTQADGPCVGQQTAVVYVPKETLENYYGNDTVAAIAGLTELAKSYPIRLSGDNRYKFSLYDYKKKFSYFISAEYYDSPIEAMKAFLFLLVLLRNKKNYYVYCDPDTGNNFIVIREILLESNRRFPTEADAWGPDGIDKLVATSQTEGAFHIYTNPDDCCFSFFVACKGKLIHPCTYDTEKARNTALAKLFKEFANYQVPVLPLVTPHASNSYYEVTYEGKLLAQLPLSGAPGNTGYCLDEFFDLLEWVLQLSKCTTVAVNGKYELLNEDGVIIAWLDNPTYTEEEWINKLVEMAVSFPVFRKDGSYYFRIPYPGMPVDTSVADPCGCDEQLPPDSCDCYVAWIGGCFDTCEAALDALNELPEKLKVEENYRAVFDCSCGSYRIEFIESEDIVAVNPQCYVTREMVCEAVERAKCLINCEGLHLVEHILLRPRPDCNDCDCLIPNCPDYDCSFAWESEEEDPCIPPASDPCFVPGLDPYSCIATIVLPAWSKRFSTQANRDLVARVLQREAPSHILLRILWLSPKDFTAFEAEYKSWVRWLASKIDYCNGPFDQCSFIDLLFNTRLNCWWPEPYCEPCGGEVIDITPCSELNSQEDRGDSCNVTVNDVYCWTTPDCCYEHRNVRLTQEQEAEKVKVVRRRTAQYKQLLQNIAERWSEDKNIGQAVSFVQANAPDEQGLLRIVKSLTDGMNYDSPEKNKVYTEVSNILMSFYLDRALLDKFDPTKLSDIKRTVRKITLDKDIMPDVLIRWHEPALNTFIHEKTLQALGGIFSN